MKVHRKQLESDLAFGVKVFSVSFVLSLSYLLVGLAFLTNGQIMDKILNKEELNQSS